MKAISAIVGDVENVQLIPIERSLIELLEDSVDENGTDNGNSDYKMEAAKRNREVIS